MPCPAGGTRIWHLSEAAILWVGAKLTAIAAKRSGL